MAPERSYLNKNFFYLLVGLWGVVWGLLVKASPVYDIIPLFGSGVLAIFVTEAFVNFYKSVLPRKNITDVSNRAVFITGCDSGFGHKVAILLHKMGFKVFAGCLFPEGEGIMSLIKETAEESERLVVIKVDVTNDEDVEDAYCVVKKHLDPSEQLWAVVNNAGIGAITEIEWCPLSLYRKVLDVNALGPIRVTKTFLPLLRQANGGRVVMVTSLASRYTLPGFSAYSMSKHAAASFADALRLEMLKWNISVHTIEPTLYRTNIADVNITKTAIDKLWIQCSNEVQGSYGEEYLNDFKTVISEHLNKARPSELISEVTDDMIDAIAGLNPKTRYVPSMMTHLKTRVLSSLPCSVRDSLFLQNQPTTPPADVRKKRLPPYKYPKGRRNAKRTISEPTREKSELTPINGQVENVFEFPEPVKKKTSMIREHDEDLVFNNNTDEHMNVEINSVTQTYEVCH